MSIEETSVRLGVSQRTLYKVCLKEGIDPKTLCEEDIDRLKELCKGTIDKKKKADEYIERMEKGELEKMPTILDKKGATIYERLEIAKKNYDFLAKTISECKRAIEMNGTIIHNANNGAISSNPAVRTLCDLLKQYDTLNKTITDLESRLSLTDKDSNPFE